MIMTILSGGAIAPALVATLSIGMATFCSCLTALVGKQTFDKNTEKLRSIKSESILNLSILIACFYFDQLALLTICL